MAAYDATNPDARKFYWSEVNKALFSIGLDAGGWTRLNRKPKAGGNLYLPQNRRGSGDLM